MLYQDKSMDKLPAILNPTAYDIALLLVASCHLGTQTVSKDMKQYIYTRRADGVFIIHLGKLWEKLILAARVIATISKDACSDVYVVSSANNDRRPAIKMAQYLGADSQCGRFSPGTFTKALAEPTVLVCLDPREDAQSINESGKCNIPVIAFANTHASLRYVDIAIPCNNMGSQSIGVMCWLLTRAVLRLRGVLNYYEPWDVIPDMFFYSEEQQQEALEANDEDWNQNQGQDWNQNQPSGDWSQDQDWNSNNQTFNQEFQSTFGSSDTTLVFATDLETAHVPQGILDWAEEDPSAMVEEKVQVVPEEEVEGWGTTSSTDKKKWTTSNTPW